MPPSGMLSALLLDSLTHLELSLPSLYGSNYSSNKCVKSKQIGIGGTLLDFRDGKGVEAVCPK